MNSLKSRRAFTMIEVAVVIGVVGLIFTGAWVWPKWFNGDVRRAKDAAAANTELIAAKDAQSSAAASSVTKIGEVAATIPDSWQKDFIGLETGVALGYLRKPDPMALARAEARRAAVAEGQRDEARRLYGLENDRAGEAEKRATKAEIQTVKVIAELQRVADERVGAEQTRNIMIAVAVLAAGLWLWTKWTHLSPDAVAHLRGELAGIGEHAVTALDGITSRLQQRLAKAVRKKLEKKAAVEAVTAAP